MEITHAKQRGVVTARRAARWSRRRWSPRWRVHTAFPKFAYMSSLVEGEKEQGGQHRRGSSKEGEKWAPAREHGASPPQATEGIEAYREEAWRGAGGSACSFQRPQHPRPRRHTQDAADARTRIAVSCSRRRLMLTYGQAHGSVVQDGRR